MQKKEFSILKWIVFPANSIILASIIAWFNLTVFGWGDGLPYSVIVAMIGVFSIVINKYTESENKNLAKAAFVFEIFLTAALVINAAYSVSVQRKMSVARMGETSQKDTITEISKLKGSRTQREALQKIDKRETAQAVFANVENILFWIMVGELALYAVSAFTLFALAKLMGEQSNAIAQPVKVSQPVISQNIPRPVHVSPRPLVRPQTPAPKIGEQKGNGVEAKHIGSAGVLD